MTKTDDDDPMLVLRERMARSLKGFKSGLPKGCDPWKLQRGRANPKLFPVPEFVLFALRDLMGFSWSSVGEKVRWSVYATVEDEPFVFEQRKFGFSIDHRNGIPPALLKRVEGQLSSSLRLLEPLLSEFAEAQIAEGKLTLENKFSEFDNRYRYFRELADNAFGPDPAPPPANAPSGEDSKDMEIFADLTSRMNRSLIRQQEGYFASGAMVDAFFSRLEHRVLLLRAFVGRPLATGEFEGFIKKTWDERAREVVEFDADPTSGKILGKLREVKATIRNPLAHGGVENDGGAFHFHMPRIGAIPANLSRYRGGLRMSFFSIANTTHVEICKLFDEVDALLEKGSLELPNEFVRWGIDPQFDNVSISRYADALAGGAETVDMLIERIGHEWERHANYEY